MFNQAINRLINQENKYSPMFVSQIRFSDISDLLSLLSSENAYFYKQRHYNIGITLKINIWSISYSHRSYQCS